MLCWLANIFHITPGGKCGSATCIAFPLCVFWFQVMSGVGAGGTTEVTQIAGPSPHLRSSDEEDRHTTPSLNTSSDKAEHVIFVKGE